MNLRLIPALSSLMLASAVPATAAPPNVLIITADDLRPELGCYGSPALTPNLDALAARGTVFNQAYCQQAVCNPSRSSMLTGLRPGKPDVTTLPLWFKDHGYTTRCVGKLFHNWHTKEKGDPRSWSAPEFLHYANHGDDTPRVEGSLPENHAKLSKGLRNYGSVGMCECYDVPDEAYYDGRVAAEAVRILPELKKGGPFLLAVGFWKPHAPFNAPKRYWDLYDRDRLPPLDPTRPIDAPEIAFHQSTEILGPPDQQTKPTPGQVAEMRHGYFAAVSYLDAQVGKVLAALRENGLEENTLVVFWGDHGYHLGEQRLWTKMTNFEHGTRVPLLVSFPGMKTAGKGTRALVELVDLYPTLAQLCDLPLPKHLEGTSFAPLLENPDQPWKKAAFSQYLRPGKPPIKGHSIRTDQWRYTEWRDPKQNLVGTELYDASESQNLAADPAHAERVNQLAAQLRAGWQAAKP
jgi:iduronate 2-sulfatase